MRHLITVLAQAMHLLPLRDSVHLGAAVTDMYLRKSGSVVHLAQLIVDHPELEPLIFELLDGKPSSTTVLEVA